MEGDANHDGKLSKDEVPPQFAERGFERADTNKDGFVDRAELVVFFQSQPRGPGGEGRGGRGGGGQPMSLEGGMKQMDRGLKGLKKSAFSAESRASDLELIQSLQGGIVAAKGHSGDVPMSKNAKAKFGEDKAAFQMAFRRQLIAALNESIALENAVLDGKANEAKASLAKLEKIGSDGHDLFKEEEEERGERGGGNRERRPTGGGQG